MALQVLTSYRYDKSEKAKQAAKVKQALENPETTVDELGNIWLGDDVRRKKEIALKLGRLGCAAVESV